MRLAIGKLLRLAGAGLESSDCEVNLVLAKHQAFENSPRMLINLFIRKLPR